MKALASPCTDALTRSAGVGRLSAVARNAVTEFAKIVLSSAGPSAPPTWRATFGRADATPASAGSAPWVAMFIVAPKTAPMPSPVTMSAGSTSAVYELCTPKRDMSTSPAPATSMPPATSQRGPNRGRKTVPPIVPVIMRLPTIGRKARPVLIGE